MKKGKQRIVALFCVLVAGAIALALVAESERRVVAYPAKERAGLKASEENASEFETLIRLHWSANKWEELEKLAVRLRSEKARFRDGTYKLHEFYDVFSRVAGTYKAFPVARFSPWLDKMPASDAARIAFAAAHIGFGWSRRGDDVGVNVTSRGWQVLTEHATAALGLLNEALTKGSRDPELFVQMIYAVGAKNGAQADLDQIFETAIKVAPDYLPLYSRRLYFGSQRWGGSLEKKKEVFKRAAQEPSAGRRLYAELAVELLAVKEDVISTHALDWQQVSSAIQELAVTRAPQIAHDPRFLYVACLMKDRSLAKAIFALRDEQKPDGKLAPMSQVTLHACRKWAAEDGPALETTVLHRAVSEHDILQVRELLSSGSDPNAVAPDSSTPLIRAVENCDGGLVETLLAAGADPGRGSMHGSSALHLAAYKCPRELVQSLLAHGASINALNENGHTALNSAAQAARPEIVSMLLAHPGVDPNSRGEAAGTPLLGAMLLNVNEGSTFKMTAQRREVIGLLLKDRRVDIQAAGEQGWTPLHCAVADDDEQLIRVFLEYGAKPDVPNFAGFTPLKLAHHWGHKDAVRIMKESRSGPYYTVANFVSKVFKIY